MRSARTVYVVDDSVDYRALIEFLFKLHLPKQPIRLFSDGQNLLDHLAVISRQPCLILLDTHMPRLNGYQTLLALKQQPVYDSIPVIMMSAAASSVEINRLLDAGANAFVDKVINLHALVECAQVYDNDI